MRKQGIAWMFLVLVWPLAACGEPLGPYVGEWQGQVGGQQSRLSIALEEDPDGDMIDGDLYVGDYYYSIIAEIEDGQVLGEMADPKTGGILPARLSLSGDGGLILHYSLPGQAEQTAHFARTGATATAPANAARGDAGRDIRLVGVWMSTTTTTGGGGSITSRFFMEYAANGQYAEWSGGSTGSFGNGSVGAVSQDRIVGEWKTQNQIVYIRAAGVPWVAYGRYHIENGSMLITKQNGRELYNRVQ